MTKDLGHVSRAAVPVETFADARSAAEASLGIPTEPWGAEDDRSFRVYEAAAGEPELVGSVEILRSAPWDMVGAPVILVDKVTGEVTQDGMLSDLERFTTMTPVGSGHPDD